MLLALCIFSGFSSYSCSSANSKKEEKRKENTQLVYENEFFSIVYPSDWEYQEEINDEYENNPSMSKGIRVTLFPKNQKTKWPVVMVQKSAMAGLYSTPEEARDASVTLKQFDKQYIGTVDKYMQDSLQFGPNPAAMAGFIYVTEEGDTIINRQLIVVTNDKETYYLNDSFDWNDDGTLEKQGAKILATFRIKE